MNRIFLRCQKTTFFSSSGVLRVNGGRNSSNNSLNNNVSLTESKQQQITRKMLRRKVFKHMGFGIIIVSIPISVWWYWSIQERKRVQEKHNAQQESRAQLPKAYQAQDTYEYIISSKCLPGDVILFDRKCERCCTSPWAAFSCVVSKQALCNIDRYDSQYIRSIDTGSYDHMGIIVPGYIKNIHDKYDPTNLLLLEATPSGIVARPLKERFEQSSSRSIILLQLNSPGEERNKIPGYKDNDEYVATDTNSRNKKKNVSSSIDEHSSRQLVVDRVRKNIEKELIKFRDTWIKAGEKQNYQYIHSTVSLGGAVAYGLGMQNYISGPVSPAAYLVLRGLQQAFAAPNINEKDNLKIKVEDYLRDFKFQEQNAIRLRPGWRFLAPITIKEK